MHLFTIVCVLQGQGTLASHSLAGRKNTSTLLRHAVGVGALGVAMRTATKTFWKTILGCTTDQVNRETSQDVFSFFPSPASFATQVEKRFSQHFLSFCGSDVAKHFADMLALRVSPESASLSRQTR